LGRIARIRRYFATLQVLTGLLFYIKKHLPVRETKQKSLYLDFFPAELTRQSNRLKTYLGIFLIFEYLFEVLTAKSLSPQAKDRSTALATLTPYFDDWTDETEDNFDDLPTFLSTPPVIIQTPADASAFLFSNAGFSWSPQWQAVAIAQLQSRAQKNGQLEEYELWDLMIQKGSSSVVLGWHVITEQVGGAGMKRCSIALGAFAQLLNDLFDVWKDREAGISTVVTRLAETDQLEPVYDRVFQTLVEEVQDLDSKRSAKRKIIAFLVIGYALGKVALKRLIRLQHQSGNRFDVHQFSRKELVCDMAKWNNRIAFAWHLLRY
jgi:hypothetical protein